MRGGGVAGAAPRRNERQQRGRAAERCTAGCGARGAGARRGGAVRYGRDAARRQLVARRGRRVAGGVGRAAGRRGARGPVGGSHVLRLDCSHVIAAPAARPAVPRITVLTGMTASAPEAALIALFASRGSLPRRPRSGSGHDLVACRDRARSLAPRAVLIFEARRGRGPRVAV
eukprot:316738-Prymnesium_polylepis.1